MFALTDQPIQAAAVRAAVEDHALGAILLFDGVVRDNFEGRPVLGLEYEAYPELAVPVMEQIGAEIAERWPGARAAMVHRTGRLGLGETSVVIAVGAPHRDAAYAASRYAIEALKARVPVWKKELYADGASWRANAS